MTNQRFRNVLLSAHIVAACVACTPTRDLDAAAAGSGRAGSGGITSNSTASTQASTILTGGSSFQQSGNVGGNAEGGVAFTAAGSTTAMGGALATGGSHYGGAGGAPELGGAGGIGGTTAAPVGGSSPISSGGTQPGSGGVATVVTSGGNEPASGGTATIVAAIGGNPPITGGVASSGGTSATTGGVKQTGGTSSATTIAEPLGDLPHAPVQGNIAYSSTASWNIGGVQREAFRIETPTATYFVVKSVAAITSLVDSGNTPWVLYSTGYRTHRGIPNLGGCCQPNPPAAQPTMTTVLDAASVTSTHLRLVSKPTDGDYFWIVWDFYVTHVTVTVNRSQTAFGFTYDGVPGNVLDSRDQLVLSNGEVKGATSYYSGDLDGPVEWAYIANGEAGNVGSLFLIQHADDNIPESYSVPDGDGSRFTFGSGQLSKTPIRFSLGLINSTDHATVRARVGYVIDNIPP